MTGIRLALIQMEIGKSKMDNLTRAANLIKKAKLEKAELIALPECFNSPYGPDFFEEFSESIPSGITCKMLTQTTHLKKVHVIAGSIPEKVQLSNGTKELYNTCTVWDPAGELVAKHRKTHLFDINIPGSIRFKESDTLSPGDALTTFKIGSWKVGVGICYDLRFNEMATLYRKMGCQLLVYPGAFNMKTGPLHWELLLRARAVDTQSYVAGIAPARDMESSYVSYGNSMLVDPLGKVLCRADAKEEVLYANLDMSLVDQVRQNIPVYSQRRTDIYDTMLVNSSKAMCN